MVIISMLASQSIAKVWDNASLIATMIAAARLDVWPLSRVSTLNVHVKCVELI